MSVKHTPGPWFGRSSHDPVFIQGADEAGLSIAFACGGGNPRRDEFIANARLIAAAPDLLAFARSIADNVVLAGSSIGAEARAVIAAATGESA